MAAMRYSHAALLVVDGNEGLVSRTELSIAAEVLKQGRALVVAVGTTACTSMCLDHHPDLTYPTVRD